MADRFFWYDLVTTDAKAAAIFYGDVVGWKVENSGMPDYDLLNIPEGAVGGLMPVPAPDMRPCWLGYIAVDDVDAAAARIAAEGGAVRRPPFDVPGIIRIAVVADPQGAGFMVAKGLRPDARPDFAMGTPGTIGWHELYATEWRAAFAFYEKLFGWTKAEAIDMGPLGTYQLFAAGGPPVGGMMTKPQPTPGPYWGFYFNVPSVEAAMGRITAGGGHVLNGPHQVPGGQWIVQAMDPQGAVFALVSLEK